ncbi:hypothetical protein BDV93DRAFT_547118 [Ceratobasidium sp. AG-I]|nr:hypothetical protein BDV93DRAFT_547118 [Ceratobasidium sp. AG-I]
MPRIPVLLSSPPTRPDIAKLRTDDLAPSGTNFAFHYTPTTPSHNERPHSKNSIPSKPRPFVYSLSTLLEIPSRLAHPPSVKSSHSSRWSIVPEMSVSLEDILSMRHVSPLSLKDFEQYLLFEEYGAENLYFILWLNDYDQQYNAGKSHLQLTHSIARAKATFFSSDSQYELNLAASRVADFCSSPGDSIDPMADHPQNRRVYSPAFSHKSLSPQDPPATPPHPSAYTGVRDDVELMLRTSARRFVRARSRNAGYQRAFCVVLGGLQTIAIALAPLLMSVLRHQGRWVRFGMIPPLWMGLTVMLCSLNGICLVIYLMGGSRQLYPFELARPPISAPLAPSPYQCSFNTAETLHDVKSLQPCLYPPSPSTTSLSPPGLLVQGPYATDGRSAENGQANTYTLPPVRPVSSLGNLFEFETAGFIPAQDQDTASMYSSADAESTLAPLSTNCGSEPSTGRFSGTTKLFFDFDSLPVKTLDATSGPSTLRSVRGPGPKGLLSAVFGPLTQIKSPAVSRAQWEVVVRSMAVSALVALVVVAVLVAAPI